MDFEGRLLCYRCVAEMATPAAVIERQQRRHYGRDSIADTLALAEELSEGGHFPLMINNMSGCRIYADLLYRGSTVCSGHLPTVISEAMTWPAGGAPWPG